MHPALRALHVGMYARLKGVEHARLMIVMEIKGRAVRCAWNVGERICGDWFCSTGLVWE